MTQLRGKVSWFGGPDDTGVSPDEGLAFIYDVDDAPHLFLTSQPAGTTGVGSATRSSAALYRLPFGIMTRCRRQELLQTVALVRAIKTGKKAYPAYPARLGTASLRPNASPISRPGLMTALGIRDRR